ncbi:MAG: hypothetical protein Q4C96_08275, partial [Planctomycetia bacterium]|nr:hypothetical protein [Planctomycetia bacterium]
MAPFNPYHFWLDYPENSQPQNHYELLGISPLERDPNLIVRAADTLIQRVQKSSPEGRIIEWQQLLTQLQQAKACLCNPSAKSQYDAKFGFHAAQKPSASKSVVSSYPSNLAMPFESSADFSSGQKNQSPGNTPKMNNAPGMSTSGMGYVPVGAGGAGNAGYVPAGA